MNCTRGVKTSTDAYKRVQTSTNEYEQYSPRASSRPFVDSFICRLKDIVALAGENFSKIAVDGAVIAIGINWNCDLDYDFLKYCRPVYK